MIAGRVFSSAVCLCALGEALPAQTQEQPPRVELTFQPDGLPLDTVVLLTEQVCGQSVVHPSDLEEFGDTVLPYFGSAILTYDEFPALLDALVRVRDLRLTTNGRLERVADPDERLLVPGPGLRFAFDRSLGEHTEDDGPLLAVIRLEHLDPEVARERVRELLYVARIRGRIVTGRNALILCSSGSDCARIWNVVRHLDVAPEQPFERVAGGFAFVEGPTWDTQRGELLFSDIHNDRIMRLRADGTVDTFREPSGRSNGLELDADGALWACLGGSRELVRIAHDGATTVLASHFDGKRLNSPNDLVLDGAGGAYFTDPRYGDASDLEQDVMGVYYVAKDGALTRVLGDLERPNGIALTDGGAMLLVAEPNKREIRAYPIEAPGKVGPGRVLFQSLAKVDGTGPDGMTVDERGVVWATYANVLAIDSTGTVLRRIPVPERPTNCTFGGSDGKTLFVTARTGLYARALDVRGAAPLAPHTPQAK